MTNLKKLFEEYRELIGGRSKLQKECLDRMSWGDKATVVQIAYRDAYNVCERAVNFCRSIAISADDRVDKFEVRVKGDPKYRNGAQYPSQYWTKFMSQPEFEHMTFEPYDEYHVYLDETQYAEAMMLSVQIALDRILKARILNKLANDEAFVVAVEFDGSDRLESIESVDCLEEIIRSMRKVARLDNFKYIEIMRFNAEHSIVFRTHTNADAARRSFEAYLELAAELDREVEERSRRELRSDIIALGVKVVDEPVVECKQSKVEPKKVRRWRFRRLAADELAKGSRNVEFISSADFIDDDDRRRYDPDEYVDEIDHNLDIQRAVEDADEEVMRMDLMAGIEPQFSFDFARHSNNPLRERG